MFWAPLALPPQGDGFLFLILFLIFKLHVGIHQETPEMGDLGQVLI